MIKKIKENKLRSICIGLSAFLFGFITVSLFNNINITYAIDTSPGCWICDANSSGNMEYSWGVNAPSKSCSAGNWYKSSTITSSTYCGASCWICDANSSGNMEYSWGVNAPSKSCSAGNWYKSSTITSPDSCVVPPTTTYTATFYANGGTFSDGSTTWSKKIYSVANNYFSDIGIPTITKSGCTLDGWHEGTTSGPVYRQYFSINKDTNFYANWNCSSSGGNTGGETNPTTYEIKYDANGGSGAPASQTKIKGTALTLSSTKPTKSGHTFVSWNTKKDGTGTTYAAGTSYTTDSGLTLYAQYKENTITYEIKYDANDGTGAPADQTKTKGTSLTLSSTKPTKEGYTFVNWNTKKDGTGSSYTAGGKYNSDANVTLYAQYEKELSEEEVQYTITFYINDGTNEKTTKKINKGEKIAKIGDPTREGYTFDGWYDKKENGREYDFSKEVNSDINLYAYWSKIGDKTNEEITENSKTGDTLIFIAWVIGIGALTYSVYYFKSKKEII